MSSAVQMLHGMIQGRDAFLEPPIIPPWDFSAASPLIWMDPSDSEVTTLQNTNEVVSITDKGLSGVSHIPYYGPESVEAGATTPLVTQAANGLNILDFDSAVSILESDSAVTTASGDYYCMSAVFSEDIAPEDRYLTLATINDFLDFRLDHYSKTTTDRLEFIVGNGQIQASDNGSWNGNILHPLSVLVIGVDTGGNKFVRVNGTDLTPNTPVGGTVNPAVNGTFITGYGEAFANALSWEGTIGDIVLEEYPLPLYEVELREGYLAHKWGLEGDLPANHPYKNAPPTINDAGRVEPTEVNLEWYYPLDTATFNSPDAITPIGDVPSGETDPGTIKFNEYTIVTGKFGNAIKPPGSTHTYIEWNSRLASDMIDPTINGGTKGTISCWINRPANTGAIILSTAQDLSFNSSRHNFFVNSAGKVRVNEAGTGGRATSESSDAVPENTWSHVAIAFDDTIPKMDMYINGVKQTTTNDTGTFQFTAAGEFYKASTWLTWFGIGNNDIPNDTAFDQFRVYSRKLSDAEIADLANETS